MAEVSEADHRSAAQMLCELGISMLEAGQATSDVDRILTAVASAHGLGQVRLVVLPTVMIVQLRDESRTIDVDSARPSGMRLDQAGAIDDLARDALDPALTPDRILARLQTIRSSKARFGGFVTLIGHVLLTTGFGLLLDPTAQAVPVYALLGLIVGLLIIGARRAPHIATILPVIAAFTATVTTAFFSGWIDDVPLRVVAPALVSFLPGLALTVGAIELTSNQVIAGASRVVFGASQLLLLSFGVVAGIYVTGSIPTTNDTGATLGWWSPLLGLLLLAAGNVLFLSAPPRSFFWVLLCLGVTYTALTLGILILGTQLAPFVGALVVIPFSRLVARFHTAPPPAVTMLASFWLLVPGAMGLLSVSDAASGGTEGLSLLVSTATSILAIAVGVLVSSSLANAVRSARGSD